MDKRLILATFVAIVTLSRIHYGATYTEIKERYKEKIGVDLTSMVSMNSNDNTPADYFKRNNGTKTLNTKTMYYRSNDGKITSFVITKMDNKYQYYIYTVGTSDNIGKAVKSSKDIEDGLLIQTDSAYYVQGIGVVQKREVDAILNTVKSSSTNYNTKKNGDSTKYLNVLDNHGIQINDSNGLKGDVYTAIALNGNSAYVQNLGYSDKGVLLGVHNTPNLLASLQLTHSGITKTVTKDSYEQIINEFVSRNPTQASVFKLVKDTSSAVKSMEEAIYNALTSSVTDNWAKGQNIRTNLDIKTFSELESTLKSAGVSSDVISYIKQTLGADGLLKNLKERKPTFNTSSGGTWDNSIGQWKYVSDGKSKITSAGWYIIDKNLYYFNSDGNMIANYAQGDGILTTDASGYGLFSGTKFEGSKSDIDKLYKSKYEELEKNIVADYISKIQETKGSLEQSLNFVMQKYSFTSSDGTSTFNSNLSTTGNSTAIQAQAGEWVKQTVQEYDGWWFKKDDDSYAKSGSYTIEGKVYKFDSDGKLLEPINGAEKTTANKNAAEIAGKWEKWTPEYKWLYKYKNSSDYPKNGIYRIDGKYYAFDEKGYLLEPTNGYDTDTTIGGGKINYSSGGGSSGSYGGGSSIGGVSSGGSSIGVNNSSGTSIGSSYGSSSGSSTGTYTGAAQSADIQKKSLFEIGIENPANTISGTISLPDGGGSITLNVPAEVMKLKLPKQYEVVNGNLKNRSHFIPNKEEVKEVIANLYSNLSLSGANNISDKTYSAMNREAVESYPAELPSDLRRMFGGDFYDTDNVVSVTDILSAAMSTIKASDGDNWTDTALNGWIISSGGNTANTVMKPEFINMLILKAYGEYIYYSTYEVDDEKDIGKVTLYITRSLPQQYAKYKDSIFNCSYLSVNNDTILTFNDILVYLYYLDQKYAPLRNADTKAAEVTEEQYMAIGINNIENQYLKEAIYYLVDQGMFTIDEISANFGKTLFQEDMNEVCKKIYTTVNRGININTRVETK